MCLRGLLSWCVLPATAGAARTALPLRLSRPPVRGGYSTTLLLIKTVLYEVQQSSWRQACHATGTAASSSAEA